LDDNNDNGRDIRTDGTNINVKDGVVLGLNQSSNSGIVTKHHKILICFGNSATLLIFQHLSCLK